MGEARHGRLSGKIALITGGGSGIGRGIAERFAREGAAVVIADSDEAASQAAAREIQSGGGTAIAPGAFDVSNPADVARLVGATVGQFGQIDILVNNAAIAGAQGDFLALPLETWQRVLAVNLGGVFLCGQAVARHMVERGIHGRIVNLGSVNSFVAERGAAAYVASKGGVRSLTQAMAVELAPHGILVNCLAPGPVRVARNAELFDGPLAAGLRAAVPLGRPGTVEEIAAAAVFLASDEASFLSGATLVVDGGVLAYLRFDEEVL
jgi:NAD(P)-dependent dehydrogenase (short-subunit alcohol dehydrogenase family)